MSDSAMRDPVAELKKASNTTFNWKIESETNGRLSVLDERGNEVQGITSLVLRCSKETGFKPVLEATVRIFDPNISIECGFEGVEFEDSTEKWQAKD